jgi:hypothetical protein
LTELAGIPGYGVLKFPGIGSRGIRLLILSACCSQAKLSWDETTWGNTKAERGFNLAHKLLDQRTAPKEAKQNNWLGAVFQCQIAIGWKESPATPQVYQLWEDYNFGFFAFLGASGSADQSVGQTVKWALDQSKWGQQQGGWAGVHLVVREIYRVRLEGDEYVYDPYYWFQQWRLRVR